MKLFLACFGASHNVRVWSADVAAAVKPVDAHDAHDPYSTGGTYDYLALQLTHNGRFHPAWAVVGGRQAGLTARKRRRRKFDDDKGLNLGQSALARFFKLSGLKPRFGRPLVR